MSALLPSQVLSAAADLVEPEGRWTQFMRARTALDSWTEPDSSTAVCWCLVGAIQRAKGGESCGAYDAAELTWVAKVVRRREPAVWNDAAGRTQAEVVAALRAAAELARGEGQ